MKHILRITIVSLIIAGSLHGQESESRPEEPFTVSDLTAELQLAVELEVSREGVKVISSRVLYGTPQEGTAHPDLTVVATRTKGGPATLRISDPRIAFDAPQNYLRGTTVVYLPFDESLTALSVAPTPRREAAGFDRHAYIIARPPFGGPARREKAVEIDLRPVVRSACSEARDIPACSPVLNR